MQHQRRHLLRTLIGAPAVLLPALATAARDGPMPALGSPLALPDLPLLDGGSFRAAQARGQVVVVYWWASWCPFCAEMSPHIEALWRSQRDKGLTVLGISVDKTAQAPRDHRRRKGYTFPTALLSPAVEAALANPQTIPVTWVRDRAGKVVMAEKGQLFPEDVEQIARFV